MWTVQETPAPWVGMLGLALLGGFGILWCALSYFNAREGDGGLERFAVHLGLLLGLGLSLKNGSRGWANKYLDGDEDMWGDLYWRYIGPAMLLLLVVIIALALMRRVMTPREGDPVPHAWAFIVVVLVVQNALAHLVTGPLTNWNEAMFNLYYVLLFFLSAAILYHYHFMQTWVPFLVAGIESDEDDVVEIPAPTSVIMDDVMEEPVEWTDASEEAEHTDEIVEEINGEAPTPETVADEVEESLETSPELQTLEEEYRAVLDEEVSALEPMDRDEPESTIAAEEDDAPEVPLESLGMADDDDTSDIEGTPMFDDDKLPTDATREEEEPGEDRLRPT